jgi:Tfp pilus assembly protein PilF
MSTLMMHRMKTSFEIALELHQNGDYEGAIENYKLALSQNPNDYRVLSNKAAALQKLRRFEDALAVYDQALKQTAVHAVIYNNRGTTLQQLHRLEESIEDFNRAIDLDGRYADALVNRGFVYHLWNEFELAISDYENAIEIAPTFAAARFNLSLSQLALGDYANGWQNYEYRWQASLDTTGRIFPDNQPLWMGQDLAGKRIFLYCEQGLGDTLQFCRYIPLVRQLGAQIVLEAPHELLRVLGQMNGVEKLIQFGQEIGPFDYQCPLMSLPLAFKTTLKSIPSPDTYLLADAVKVDYWRTKLGGFNRMKVGLVWSGGFRPDQPRLWAVNERRNLPFQYFSAFEGVNADFFSLQKGAVVGFENQHAYAKFKVHNFTDELHDFSDTAAFIDNLDLVISVDTSTAHLAAALGKPTWILNRFDACWRWLVDRTDSPWYSHVRLYRQKQDGEWNSVIEQTVSDLTKLAGHI